MCKALLEGPGTQGITGHSPGPQWASRIVEHLFLTPAVGPTVIVQDSGVTERHSTVVLILEITQNVTLFLSYLKK